MEICEKEVKCDYKHSTVPIVHQPTPMANDDESDNVEYIEESICEESTPFVDKFYSNAVYCLIALYRQKYQEMLNLSRTEIQQLPLWSDISKDMNESYFPFSAWEVQQKFQLLRRQYFSVAESPHDCESFEYFENMHEIYQDATIDALSQGNQVPINKEVSYADDVLFEEPQPPAQAKEDFEILDIIERELNALKEDIDSIECNVKNEQPPEKDCPLKRNHEIPDSSHPPMKIPKLGTDMSLREYNDEQERRHREHMALLEQNAKLQQNLLDKIESLIKRNS